MPWPGRRVTVRPATGPSPVGSSEQLAFDDVEELVLVRMMMPMELTFDDRKPEQAVVDSDQAAVVPRLDGVCESRDVEPLKRLVGKFRFEGVARIHFCHGTVMP